MSSGNPSAFVQTQTQTNWIELNSWKCHWTTYDSMNNPHFKLLNILIRNSA